MEGETSQPSLESERNRTPAETAADFLIDGISKYPSTDYEVGAYLALKCREQSLNPKELSASLLADESEINRITLAANSRHKRAQDTNTNIPPETITADDIRIVARTIFDVASELDELTTKEITTMLNHTFPGSENLDKATLDDMRRMYVTELKKQKLKS